MALRVSTRLDRRRLGRCQFERDRLVGGARLGATDADLHAGWMELGSAERHGQVQDDDLVTD